MRVAAAGGQLTPATEFSGKESHHFPLFLPDGRHFLYLARSGPNYQEHLSVRRQPGCEGAVPSSWPDRPTWCRHILSDRSRVVRAGCHSDGPSLPSASVPGRANPATPSNCRARRVASWKFSTPAMAALLTLNGGVDSELAWFDRTGRQLGLAGKRGQYRNPELFIGRQVRGLQSRPAARPLGAGYRERSRYPADVACRRRPYANLVSRHAEPRIFFGETGWNSVCSCGRRYGGRHSAVGKPDRTNSRPLVS